MTLKSSIHIFDSFKFCYRVNKLSGYLFFSIRKDSGRFYSTTTPWDVILFITSLTIKSYSLAIIFKLPLIISSRSIMIQIGIFMYLKAVVFHPMILILMNFYNRHEMFKIIKNLEWIDEKVRNGLFYFLLFLKLE